MEIKLKNKILLPRGYLSPSAMSTFKRSQEEYIRHYFYGEPGFTSPEMSFGSNFAEHMENGAEHEDKIVDMVMKSIPRLGKPEESIRAKLPSKWGDIVLVGKLDDYDPNTHAFNEFKTGRRKWTVGMAHNHNQLKFYALILWLNHGVVQQKKNLIWVETEQTQSGIVPTGIVKTFPVEYTLAELMIFGNEVIRVAKTISDLYKEHIEQLA